MILVVVGIAFVLSALATFILSRGRADPLACGVLGGLIALIACALRVFVGWDL